jgi:hypothetical protein
MWFRWAPRSGDLWEHEMQSCVDITLCVGGRKESEGKPVSKITSFYDFKDHVGMMAWV